MAFGWVTDYTICFVNHNTIQYTAVRRIILRQTHKIVNISSFDLFNDSVIYQLKSVNVNSVIALPTANHMSYFAGGRLKMSFDLDVRNINKIVKMLLCMNTT